MSAYIEKEITETINYTYENGHYCGVAENMPLRVHADTLEMLKSTMKVMVKIYINQLTSTYDNDLFEYVEQPVI